MTDVAYSVVIPAHNAEKFIGSSIESVFAQSVPPELVIVVDDGSTDGTSAVVRSIDAPVRLLNTPNRGAGPATTTGVEHVNSLIVAMLDADDLWRPNKMERQLSYLAENAGQVEAIVARMEPFGDTHLKSSDAEKSGWHRSTLVIRTQAFRRVGPVENLGNGYGDMVDWFARARDVGVGFHVLDEVLADRRIHPHSLSFQAGREREKDYLHAAIRALQRKKQQGK